ncbi:MAG: class I tRNA ligase family protein [Candidatus Saccharimonadales bacterium]
MKRYNPKDLEPKWQKTWASDKLYKAVDFDKTRPKYVVLTEFPYPSGDGLHLGHVREYTLGDVMARYKRQHGYNVLYPMGYDAFGLPTENYAIKNKIAPQVATERNVGNFQKQFDSLGYSIDWDRSFRTTDPDYYKWTQWLFLQFFKEGLAYQDKVAINWCPHCKTGLANEEVVNGRHERCDTLVEKKTLKQWMLAITKYADRLIDGLQDVDYPSRIADQQVNWIGRSKGAEVDFALEDGNKIRVFTTRPDTLFGATFVVLAPEHPLVASITSAEQKPHVNSYIKAAQGKSEIERQNTDREKTGVFTGAHAINPVNGKKIPVWIADYVLTGYGTGAIMAVPAHDERDYEFAQKFELPINEVIEPEFGKIQGDETHKEAIIAIVRNPKTKKVLVLNWGPRRDNWGGNLFIGGGIEKDEDPIDCAVREITEETGYTNLKHIKTSASYVNNYFFSNVKNKNYKARFLPMLFELVDEAQVETNLDDNEGQFKLEWVAESKISNTITDEAHLHGYLQLVQPNAYGSEGQMINSGKYNGMPSSEARDKIVADLVKAGNGEEKINYRLRDWIFSRQHYWGEPIPIIHCPKDGAVPVPEDQLPVVLPKVEHYEPTDDGQSPLAEITDWVNVKCPKCGGDAKRETDTMPNWAGSSWYYLRYYDAHNDKAFADKEKLKYWGEVDMYLGGMEHTTLHLLYSRFWHQFFYDQGLVPTPEPYASRRGQGIILAADGTKMSKSKGNIVNPNEILEQGYGADALRLSIVFLAPYDQTTPWSPEGIGGTFRFLQRVWTLTQEYLEADSKSESLNPKLATATHKAIKKVSQDLHQMSFNTAVAALMEFVNELYKIKAEDKFASKEWPFALKALLQLLAPYAPHISEELWKQLGHEQTIHTSQWPTWEEKYLIADTMTIVVQVNGKVRAQVEVPADSTEEMIIETAKSDQKISSYLDGKTVKKTIYVPGKLVSFVAA